jgi:hypothetical protein
MFDGDRDLALRVFTGDPSGTTFTPVAESTTQTIPAGVFKSYPTRIPVSGGELLGLHIPVGPNVNGCIYPGAGGGNTWGIADTVMPVGQAETHTQIPDGRVNVSAVLEADADHDGYGDETQDLCPSDASNQGPCNKFSFGSPVLKKNGSALLPATFPGPGSAVVEDAGLASARASISKKKKKRLIKTRTTAIAAAGTVSLKIKPTRAAKKRLKQGKAVKVQVKVTFTPTGGTALSQIKAVKLKKKTQH